MKILICAVKVMSSKYTTGKTILPSMNSSKWSLTKVTLRSLSAMGIQASHLLLSKSSLTNCFQSTANQSTLAAVIHARFTSTGKLTSNQLLLHLAVGKSTRILTCVAREMSRSLETGKTRLRLTNSRKLSRLRTTQLSLSVQVSQASRMPHSRSSRTS